MQNLSNLKSEDEVDMRELFFTLWAYKFLIVATCTLGIVYAGYNILNTDKKFTSKAIFILDDGTSGNIAINNQLGALASFAGFNSGPNINAVPIDLVTGTLFIKNLTHV